MTAVSTDEVELSWRQLVRWRPMSLTDDMPARIIILIAIPERLPERGAPERDVALAAWRAQINDAVATGHIDVRDALRVWAGVAADDPVGQGGDGTTSASDGGC